MKYSLFTACLLVTLGSSDLGIGAEAESRSNAKAAGLDMEQLEALDRAMEEQVEQKQISGVIGLIARRGKIGYYETFGQRVIGEEAPMTKDTLFRIYSMTKPIVAVTAMTLWEEGKFKLDDPIADHLPEWKEVTVKSGDEAVPAEQPITPRHLMTHSSGITYGRTGLKLGKEVTLEEFSQSLAKRPLSFQPGTSYAYGYSTDVLGRYLEAVAGKSLDVVMQERIFDRLGMKDTGFWVRKADDRGRTAKVYRRTKEGELKPVMSRSELMTKPARMMGGQGLVSTTGDYARFCEMLTNKGELNGQRVLKTATVDLMLKNHLKEIGKVYGLGGMVDGKGRYHWGGAAGTRFWVDTAQECYGVFMIQTWGYKAPTWDVFRGIAEKAILPGAAASGLAE